ncbi:VOC family protein [Brenneria corticis]|uniref:VOC family protein n=1 Tax=Brenneria corticis TaxID=2173106 RepID=A0A2U1TT60_9GAMM|nr:VOC family protein [Brenneria sp. CFCC 11842]PWC12597.1 VOC family protein [Brenneria sp. CFCC 11842]
MAKLLWDHVVHYVNHLDEAIARFNENGLVAFPGGSHPGWGTHNALSYFGLTYIEFLGIRDADELSAAADKQLLCRELKHYLPQEQILSHLALRTDNIEAIADRLRHEGLQLSPILAGKRHDAGGNLIEWKMFTIDGDFQGLAYPFVLQWGNDDEQRLRQLRERGIDRPHPAGEAEIRSALFHVAAPQEVAAHWQRLFSLAPDPDDAATLHIGGQRFIFREGAGNRLAAINLETDSPLLKGNNINIGLGEYRFN